MSPVLQHAAHDHREARDPREVARAAPPHRHPVSLSELRREQLRAHPRRVVDRRRLIRIQPRPRRRWQPQPRGRRDAGPRRPPRHRRQRSPPPAHQRRPLTRRHDNALPRRCECRPAAGREDRGPPTGAISPSAYRARRGSARSSLPVPRPLVLVAPVSHRRRARVPADQTPTGARTRPARRDSRPSATSRSGTRSCWMPAGRPPPNVYVVVNRPLPVTCSCTP